MLGWSCTVCQIYNTNAWLVLYGVSDSQHQCLVSLVRLSDLQHQCLVGLVLCVRFTTSMLGWSCTVCQIYNTNAWLVLYGVSVLQHQYLICLVLCVRFPLVSHLRICEASFFFCFQNFTSMFKIIINAFFMFSDFSEEFESIAIRRRLSENTST